MDATLAIVLRPAPAAIHSWPDLGNVHFAIRALDSPRGECELSRDKVVPVGLQAMSHDLCEYSCVMST